jgi:predicted transcriptional regulator of viral defense system
MNLYFELLKYPVFSVEELREFYENKGSARTAIKSLMKQGLVAKIRNNLYTCISGETGAPVANRFQIASAISDTSYVSHHTAMEYYGIADQVYYDVYVASETGFRSFEFDGYTYNRVPMHFTEGIYSIEFGGGIRISDKERTLIDCIKDMDKIAGVEEVVANIESMGRVDEDRLLHYLGLYNTQFLYQKTGCMLWRNRDSLGLSDNFFEACKERIGKSKRYLSSDYQKGRYDDCWKLVVPELLWDRKNGVIVSDIV